MLSITPGSLVIVDPNTTAQAVFWKGSKLDGLTGVHIAGGSVSLSIGSQLPEPTRLELEAAGIKVKNGGQHE